MPTNQKKTTFTGGFLLSYSFQEIRLHTLFVNDVTQHTNNDKVVNVLSTQESVGILNVEHS